MLFVLALVAVAAPVWSDLYVCPMERAARDRTPRCCAGTEAVSAPLPGRPQFQVPCDCARLDWPSQALDNASRQGVVELPVALAPAQLPAIPAFPNRTASLAPSRVPVDWSGPPLWVVNLSIRC